MHRAVAVLNLTVSGFYAYSITAHMLRPGDQVAYTRMLMFVCLATIPVVFMLAMIGGSDRWPALWQMWRSGTSGGVLKLLVLAGVALVLILMPLGMLAGAWFGMGLKFGSLFLLFFIPLLMRLAFSPAQASIQTAILQALLYFGSFFAALGLVRVLGWFQVNLSVYARNVQAIWPGYGDATVMFFAVCIFALANQAIELRQAASVLLGKG